MFRPTQLARSIPFLLIAGLALAAGVTLAKDRDALWKIAHGKCVPNEEAHRGPAPCARVVLDHGKDGYVILKDIRGATQFLLIPTRRISGIESPALLAPDAPNYWADAWANRGFVISRAKAPLRWDMIGLAINSAGRRSQDQLHIHIDCVQPYVRNLVAAHIASIGTTWNVLPFDLAGRNYFARSLAAPDLANENPFKLLAEGVPGAREHMAEQSLAIIGTSPAGRNGFVLLAARGAPGKPGMHSEDLLDHGCALARMK